MRQRSQSGRWSKAGRERSVDLLKSESDPHPGDEWYWGGLPEVGSEARMRSRLEYYKVRNLLVPHAIKS